MTGMATLSLSCGSVLPIGAFFDYDFQNSQLSLYEINRRVEEMLKLFDDETDNGKLYINYPMIESIRYTRDKYLKVRDNWD